MQILWIYGGWDSLGTLAGEVKVRVAESRSS